jgi:hypothetical protein
LDGEEDPSLKKEEGSRSVKKRDATERRREYGTTE